MIGVCKLRNCDGVCLVIMNVFMDEIGEWVKIGFDVIVNRMRYIINNFMIYFDYKDCLYVKNYFYF